MRKGSGERKIKYAQFNYEKKLLKKARKIPIR